MSNYCELLILVCTCQHTRCTRPFFFFKKVRSNLRLCLPCLFPPFLIEPSMKLKERSMCLKSFFLNGRVSHCFSFRDNFSSKRKVNGYSFLFMLNRDIYIVREMEVAALVNKYLRRKHINRELTI